MQNVYASESDMIEALTSRFSVIGVCALQPEMANAISTKLHEIKKESKALSSDTDDLIEALRARSLLHLGGCILDYATAKEISLVISNKR